MKTIKDLRWWIIMLPALKAVSYVPVFILGACLVPLALLAVFVLSGYVQRVVPQEVRGYE